MKNDANDWSDLPVTGERLRRIIGQLKNANDGSTVRSDAHLDNDVIAKLLEGDGLDAARRRDAIAHLSSCSICRGRVAGVSLLLDDASVADEIKQLDQPAATKVARRRRLYGIVPAVLAAAAVIAVLIAGPGTIRARDSVSSNTVPVSREGVAAAAAAPRILSPVTVAGAGDSLRWTSVPEADLYRIRIWNSDGTVVWAGDTRDTTLPIPARVMSSGGSYLWEIKARTGWDRWVTSDFLEFTVRSNPH